MHYRPMSSFDCPGAASRDLVASYPPKKKKYPGISRAIVDVKPLNKPLTPSLLRIFLVSWNGPILF